MLRSKVFFTFGVTERSWQKKKELSFRKNSLQQGLGEGTYENEGSARSYAPNAEAT
jgi:hypothetical protein